MTNRWSRGLGMNAKSCLYEGEILPTVILWGRDTGKCSLDEVFEKNGRSDLNG